MIQIEHSQAPHVVEGPRWDLGNTIPTKAELFQSFWEA